MGLQIGKRTLKVGDKIERKAVHTALQGQGQSRISPSPGTHNIFVFSDPSDAEKTGYMDRWGADGHYHVVGEGPEGDHTMRRGNLRLASHAVNGNALHLFFGNGRRGPVTYQGRFECVGMYAADAPEAGGGPLRRVFIFKLKPLETTPPATVSPEVPATKTTVAVVDVEPHITVRARINPNGKPTENEMREAALVQDYKRHLVGTGRPVARHRIQPEGEPTPFYTTLFEPDRGLLVEASGTASRDALRLALGQLLDYARLIEPRPKRMAVLVPSRLRADLKSLLHFHKVGVIAQTEDGSFEEDFPK